MDIRLEEAILKELQQTNEHVKTDKIESFAKYVEACFRNMTSDVSKRAIKKSQKCYFLKKIHKSNFINFVFC